MYYDKNAGITQFFLSLLTNPQKNQELWTYKQYYQT